MKHLLWLPVIWALASCGGGSDEAGEVVVDTTLMYINLPPPSAEDSAAAPSRDSVLATLAAYSSKKITADAAAQVLLDYVLVGGELNLELGDSLHTAMARELRRRAARRPS